MVLRTHDAEQEALGPMDIDNVDSFCPDVDSASTHRLATLVEHRDGRRRHISRRYHDPGTGLWRPSDDATMPHGSDHRGGHSANSSTLGSGSAPPSSSLAGAAATATAAPPIGAVQMWCGAGAALRTWMSLPEVAIALHVVGGPHKFNYVIQLMDLSPLYTKFSQRPNLHFVIYNGQADANVPYNGQVDLWAKQARVIEAWAPWFRGPYVPSSKPPYPSSAASAPAAGHYKSYRSNATDSNSSVFYFVLVSGAGHEVPEYRPAAALWMLRSFVLTSHA
jgi:hypothetical protein